MRVLVVTCAHRGDDARIVHRQARALLEAGHEVVLVSPTPADTSLDPVGLERVAVRRATGRRRVRAWADVRRAVGDRIAHTDLLLFHDPELNVVIRRRWRRHVTIVWDVHEDYAASARVRTWIPRPLRRVTAGIVSLLQRRAARRYRVILAEHSYQATFPGAPVVPNSTWIPDLPADPAPRTPPEVVYVGRVSRGRGIVEMIEVGEALAGEATVVVVGAPDSDVVDLVAEAAQRGAIDARGPLANPDAMSLVRGALAGLSLLHDEPNYHHSMPTKLIEYMANGVPAITTPLPLAAELVADADAGTVVPFGDASAVAAAVRALAGDHHEWLRQVRAGHAHVAERHSWDGDGPRFVALLEGWALEGPAPV